MYLSKWRPHPNTAGNKDQFWQFDIKIFAFFSILVSIKTSFSFLSTIKYLKKPIHFRLDNKVIDSKLDSAFSLARYSITHTCLIPVYPLGCTVHAKLCTAQHRGMYKWAFRYTGNPFRLKNVSACDNVFSCKSCMMNKDITFHSLQYSKPLLQCWTAGRLGSTLLINILRIQ